MKLHANIKYYSQIHKIECTLLSTEIFKTKPYTIIPEEIYASKRKILKFLEVFWIFVYVTYKFKEYVLNQVFRQLLKIQKRLVTMMMILPLLLLVTIR